MFRKRSAKRSIGGVPRRASADSPASTTADMARMASAATRGPPHRLALSADCGGPARRDSNGQAAAGVTASTTAYVTQPPRW